MAPNADAVLFVRDPNSELLFVDPTVDAGCAVEPKADAGWAVDPKAEVDAG